MSDFSLIDLFRAEVESHTAALNSGLLTLENNAGDPAAIEPLMRAAHSIKGAARIVGLDAIVSLAHAMEDLFVAAQEKKITLNSAHIDLLLQGVDLLAKLKDLPEAEINPWLASQEQVLHALQENIRSVSTGGETPATEGEPTPAIPPETAVPTSPPPATAAATVTTPAPTPSAEMEDKNRAVRVAAETLDQLLNIAAETLVETSRLEPYLAKFELIKKNHERLSTALTELRNLPRNEQTLSRVEDLWHEIWHRLSETKQIANNRAVEFEAYSRRATALTERLYRQVISGRMRPFREGTAAFPRLVRDVARRLGKNVKLEIIGEDTLVDRDSLEKLEAPLGHIIRNALDHGLETPADRERDGKSPDGRIKLEARHHAGMLILTVSDDGCGVNRDRIRAKAVEKGFITEEMAAGLSDEELFDFMFLPGFSTSEQITEISGRGVGLDVVHATIQELGGTVQIESQPGRGTAFIMELPVTRSVIRALLVNIGGDPYAFPLARIERTVKIALQDLEMANDRVHFRLDSKLVPLIAGTELLGLPVEDQARKDISIVVIGEDKKFYGIEIDTFLGERRVVVRPLDPRLGKVPDVSAASVMEDGRPLLILDVDDLLCSIESQISGGNLSLLRKESDIVERRRGRRVLVVEDSLTVRELERKLLENAGYQVDCAVDGMEGWNAVRLAEYDLVITDVDMPRMNGLDLVRHIRADARLQSLPVVIVSYKDREEDRLRGLEVGANYYLTKGSFHDASLLSAVVDLIGEAR